MQRKESKQTDRQMYRQTDIQNNTRKDRQTENIQLNRQTDTRKDSQSNRHKTGEKGINTDREKIIQTIRGTNRHTDASTNISIHSGVNLV